MNTQVSPPANSLPRRIATNLRGYGLLGNARLNKGTAFTDDERDRFRLHGLLPPHVGTLDEQVTRRKKALDAQTTPFARYTFMRDLQDQNETLFYALISRHIEETMPIVYTPAVGEGCQRFSETWKKPRGVFISYPNRKRIDQILSAPRYDQVKCIVVSDGERILGLGDQGAGGMGIPIGKMALYTALAGIPPECCLPILLDVGTDNEARLNDNLYIGWCHRRVRGPEYDEFVGDFVEAVMRRWPHVLLQWEDFANANAGRLLERYRSRLCTFNDDIQGTAAVTTGTLLSAINVTGVPLKDQRVVVVGFGSAGIGISDLLISLWQDQGLSDAQARARLYAVGRPGLLIQGAPGVRATQLPYARPPSEIEGWGLSPGGPISLLDLVRHAKPTVLIGVSCQPGIFAEDVVREMAKHSKRPIIFPLSNPTSQSEATPQQLLDWTNGRALVGTGSPFEPVTSHGKVFRIAQTNNSYVFPGLALGTISSRARHVSDAMVKAAAAKLAELSPARNNPKGDLLPPMGTIRSVSLTIARAVGTQAINEGLAGVDQLGFEEELAANVWDPAYVPYEPAAE